MGKSFFRSTAVFANFQNFLGLRRKKKRKGKREQIKNGNKTEKERKEIKWYTYVDSGLDSKLKQFMEQYNIKNQSKIIRNFVNFYLDNVHQILQKDNEWCVFRNKRKINFYKNSNY